MTTPGALFVVSTPIGNLGDMTVRGIETLRTVDLILAEDTRHSQTLVRHFEVETKLTSYHEHNEAEMTPRVIEALARGQRVALISDAGTPLLSDPGQRLVQAVIDAGFSVVPVPGASALLAALVGAGLDTSAFTYLGFLPRKGGDRDRAIAAVSAHSHTSVLYEAPTRVVATLQDLSEAGCGNRRAVVARELTKQFEEFRRGTVDELAQYYREHAPRGEVVILIEARTVVQTSEPELRGIARELRAKGYSSRAIATALQDEHGASRNQAYRLAHEGT
ncbi:MAG: 16S rRNA (cytidine(1402)-2'-O)-methyltransferase [Gemmatimonadaceae bacterium]